MLIMPLSSGGWIFVSPAASRNGAGSTGSTIPTRKRDSDEPARPGWVPAGVPPPRGWPARRRHSQNSTTTPPMTRMMPQSENPPSAIARRLAPDGGAAAGAARLRFELRHPPIEFGELGGHFGVARRCAVCVLPPLAICRVVAVSIKILGLARR